MSPAFSQFRDLAISPSFNPPESESSPMPSIRRTLRALAPAAALAAAAALISLAPAAPRAAEGGPTAPPAPASAAPLKPLVERLGFAPGTKVVILNGDDTGMNHATNVATFAAMKAGGLTSATIMMPCPWVPEAVKFAKKHPQANFGLHLTLTSEWGDYKWGPVAGKSAVPSLVDKEGYFQSDVPPVYLKAKVPEVEIEVRAQVEKAYAAGLDVTHVDSHMGTLQYNPKYHEMYLKVAKEYSLPCRMAGHNLMDPRGGAYLIQMADDMGVLHPDMLYMDGPPKPAQTEEFWLKRLTDLPEGQVSEIYIHCGMETPEMEATTGSFRTRAADAAFFASDKWLKALKDNNIGLTSYRELRELQRTGVAPPIKTFYGWEDEKK